MKYITIKVGEVDEGDVTIEVPYAPPPNISGWLILCSMADERGMLLLKYEIGRAAVQAACAEGGADEQVWSQWEAVFAEHPIVPLVVGERILKEEGWNG